MSPSRARTSPPAARHPSRRIWFITIVAVLINGYHLGTGDSAIWIPAIKKIADPALFRYNNEFFEAQTRWSAFPGLLGFPSRLFPASVDSLLFLVHFLSVFLLLIAAWRLASVCFEHETARWGAVGLLACGLTVPVAGAGISLFDSSVSARSLATPFLVFALAAFAGHRPLRGFLWWLGAALMHPLVGFYGLVFLALLAVVPRLWPAPRQVPLYGLPAVAFPFLWGLDPVRGSARDALLSRTSWFVTEWQWYQWLAVAAPLAILWCLALMPPKGGAEAFRSLVRTSVPFGIATCAAALAVSSNIHLQSYARAQPMLALDLVYLIFVVVVGGLLGEASLQRRRRRWVALFVPVGIVVFWMQRLVYPGSSDIELPGARSANHWVAAFQWVRENTPKDAIFAIDPGYLRVRGEDRHGFRAIAERSSLNDLESDGAAAALFPELADEWVDQVEEQSGWRHFELADYQRLARERPIAWIVKASPAPAGMLCPYDNPDVAVCRIPNAGGRE